MHTVNPSFRPVNERIKSSRDGRAAALLKKDDREDGVQPELTGSGHRSDAHDVQPEKDQVRDQQRGQPHSK
jgi:hypothetical protein